MPEKSFYRIDVPGIDILSWLFPQGHDASNQPLWIDAKQPNRFSLSPKQLLEWVKRMGFGLERLGLSQQDTILIHSMNHIFVPVAYLGATGNGYVFSGCNPAYGVDGMNAS